MRRLSRRRKARTDSGTYLIDGPLLLSEALTAGVDLLSVFVEPAGRDLPAVAAARADGVRIHDVQEGALARVLDVPTPQAVVSVAAIEVATVADVLARAGDRKRPVLVLVEMQDPGNVGTLVRVAEAAGCAGVVLTERSVDVHNPKTVRATAGALFRVAVAEDVDPVALLAAAASEGVASWATVRDGGHPVDEVDLSGPLLLLVGSESHGLPADLVAAANGRLSIPMEGSVESLNAAVAGGLVAFEAARQRRRLAGRTPSTVGAACHDHDPDGAREPVRGDGSPLGHDVIAPVTDGGGDVTEERAT